MKKATARLVCAILFAIGLSIFLPLMYIIYSIYNKESIHQAAAAGNVKELSRLLALDASRVNQLDRLQMTPLHHSAYRGKPQAARFLLEHGADPNSSWDLVATGDGHWTPLHIAARQGDAEVVAVLVQHGADVNALTLRSQTPLDLALEVGNPNAVQALVAVGGVRQSDLPPKAR
jgi:ankyrin repeat protein